MSIEWSATQAAGNAYVLRNEGTDQATGVTIDGQRGLNGLGHNLPAGESLAPYQGWTFNVLRVDEVPTPTEVWVTWDGQDEPVAVPLR